jgi:hypothetical protein
VCGLGKQRENYGFLPSWEKTGVWQEKKWATGVTQNQRIQRIHITCISVDIEKLLSRDLCTILTVVDMS